MLKLSFEKKKVQVFNSKCVVVTLTGNVKDLESTTFSFDFPKGFWKWMATLKRPILFQQNKMTFQGKAICSDNDTFDLKTGERIAEARAKIKAYHTMEVMCGKLFRHYIKKAFGNQAKECLDEIWKMQVAGKPLDGGLWDACSKYIELYGQEVDHLNKLLKEA
jgi:hypothetical protein